MSLMQRFNEHEDSLIRNFHKHPFFANFQELTDAQLREYLIQKWFLSQNFVPWYDRAINGLTDEESKQVLKKIVQDETPIGAPSHREDLLADLEFIGIPREKVLIAKQKRDTLKTVHRLNELAEYTNEPDHDLKVMTALRTAGEILVAEEYRHVVPELEKRYGLTPKKSRFYAPHFYHDRKDSETGQHTHSFESVLERMICDEARLMVAVESAENAFRVRTSFYDQFTKTYKIKRNLGITGTVAASIVGIALLTNILRHNDKKEYVAFLQSLEPEARTFYLNADKYLAEQYLKTGNLGYLANIGTLEATREVWGEGP